MKIAILILKCSMAVLVVFSVLCFYFLNVGDSIDPIELEFFIITALVALGLGLSMFLILRAKIISLILFWVLFVVFILVFALPALLSSVVLLLFMTSG